MRLDQHECPVANCSRMVSDEYLMCPTHWRKVTPATQREVYRTYRALCKGTLGERYYGAARTQAVREAQK